MNFTVARTNLLIGGKKDGSIVQKWIAMDWFNQSTQTYFSNIENS